MDGKEDPSDFLLERFGVVYSVEFESKPGKIRTTVDFIDRYSKKHHFHTFLQLTKNHDPVECCLKFFRTDNGKISGPCSCLVFDYEQWT